MITEIPTADEYHAAGVNQLYLAWQIAMQAVEDFDQVMDFDLAEEEEAQATEA